MPNWIINKLSFEGSSADVLNLLQSISSEEESIDFNNIIPRPKDLDDVTSSGFGINNDIGCALASYFDKGERKSLEESMQWVWAKNLITQNNIKNVEEWATYLIQNKDYKNRIENGRKLLRNLELYGYSDWYTWSIDKWGTKWNAKDTYTTSEGEVVFQTAWSTPFQVLIELSKQYPEVILKIRFADESIGSNCGEYHLQKGEVIHEVEYDEIEACELWGYDPYELFDYMKREKNINEILEDDNDNSGV